jgi:hypothetical protein
MDYILKSISLLNSLARERLQKDIVSEHERWKLLDQLIRYGVCTCHCHFSANVYHSAEPCCGNARLATE